MTRLNPLNSTLMPPHTGISSLRVATYNIHKGVRGLGPRKRLEIHNLGLAVEALDADIVFLQEVRLFHTREAQRFDRTHFGWPQQGQADYLAPEGYEVAYRTNAVTRHGEHGNALLSRWPETRLEPSLDRIRAFPGVLDVLQTPAFGKKGRLTAHIQVLAEPGATEGVIDACFRKGLLLLGCGETALRFCPALCVTAEQVATGLRILGEVLG